MKILKYVLMGVFLIGFNSPEAQSRDYFIRKGHQFADGTLNLNRWFLGTKMEFKAAFNSSNIYTLPASEQADSNKLFGFADCKNFAQESSARFGWRWYNNRIEITAVSHYDGRWHLIEFLGVAELNKVYDFKIELSEDKAHYLFTFNRGQTFMMKRDCTQDTMMGYFLYPFFGGSEKAPHDMTVSVWTEEKANFALEKAGPNPLKSGEKLNMKLRVGEDMDIEFQIFNLIGQLVYKTDPISFVGSDEQQSYELYVPAHLSSGMYLIRPVSYKNDKLIPGYVIGSGGDSYKLIFMK
jgi:hypothetical protein